MEDSNISNHIPLADEDEKHREFIASDVPNDAKVISFLLKSINIVNYEPKVINQLMEFMHRYVSEVLIDADEYKNHSGRDHIDLEDVKLAVQSRVNHSFVQPPPRQAMVEMARNKNSKPLPNVPDSHGCVILPKEQDCLTSVNYQVEPRKLDK